MRRGAFEIFHVDHRAARDHTVLRVHVFHPSDGIAVRGNSSLLEGVRGEKRADDAVERRRDFRLLRRFQALFDVLRGASLFLGEGISCCQQEQRNCNYGDDARAQNHFHVLSDRLALRTVIRAGMEGKELRAKRLLSAIVR